MTLCTDQLCKCNYWANTGEYLPLNMITGHHVNCERFTFEEIQRGTVDLLSDLVRGIEEWAANEDGVPDFIYEQYRCAKMIIGERNPPTAGEGDEG